MFRRSQLHILIFATIAAINVACSSDGGAEGDVYVIKAMEALDSAIVKTHEPPFEQSEGELLRKWRSIPVTDAPPDFRIAWSKAHRAYAATLDGEITETDLQQYNEALANLEIIASQYSPIIKDRLRLREEIHGLIKEEL